MFFLDERSIPDDGKKIIICVIKKVHCFKGLIVAIEPLFPNFRLIHAKDTKKAFSLYEENFGQVHLILLSNNIRGIWRLLVRDIRRIDEHVPIMYIGYPYKSNEKAIKRLKNRSLLNSTAWKSTFNLRREVTRLFPGENTHAYAFI